MSMRAAFAPLAVALLAVLAFALAAERAQAADCPGNPNAMGVSRAIVLDPVQHPRLGTLQYHESLPLNDHEVVLTFDDGPLPPYTTRILDTLASECIKATFFVVGRMALGYPRLLQREYNEGHTIAGHSQNHPFTFAKMSVEAAAKEIEDGFESLRTVLGDPRAVAPFFRIPGLLRQDAVEEYLEQHRYATFSLDFLADDWTHISAKEIVRRAVQRIEARKRGILLLHDIQPATALGLPMLLAELKARGYKIVHVVPSTPDRPATVALSDDWVQRHPPRPSWPRVLPAASAEPAWDVPSAGSFGMSEATGEIVALDARALAKVPWASIPGVNVPAGPDQLPAPAAGEFRYYPRAAKATLAELPKLPRHPAAKLALKPGRPPKGIGPSPARTSKPVGHQLSIGKPIAADSLRFGRN